MRHLDLMRFRPAREPDAPMVAALHAASWRRHYRGAYSDTYLDGDVIDDRVALWNDRLREPSDRQYTLLAEEDDVVVGFAHTILDEHPTWGALLDNLHVSDGFQRRGIGGRLLRLSAEVVAERTPGSGFYLWVLEQNRPAQSFYRALGGRCIQRADVPPPGGVPARLNGSPACLRYAWPEAREVLQT
ncbi:MAG: GNAT family N-acetyltransferase [Streptosporangiales bacterium]|nr:GNAT family N-acetyltransferase [Streptosporangiales bacterium]